MRSTARFLASILHWDSQSRFCLLNRHSRLSPSRCPDYMRNAPRTITETLDRLTIRGLPKWEGELRSKRQREKARICRRHELRTDLL